ncbi:hypothetical protein PR202_gb11088 [Eleusine coracana subsp. coracana]|uniref:Uncharacterized protein n=1 Tax=Eleusine coracana subsp. coracana TaxID=191504 RepID=A0AAV5EJN7_ELECO|nr:hypothetical protein PR202_gb11088 [Eleusine coracana subsp. coracana]
MSVATTASRGMMRALGRCVRVSLRALVRARDLYVTRMAACAGAGGRGLVAVPRSQSHGFYYRSAADGDDADVRELIRAATSSRAHGGGGHRPPHAGVGARSRSVAFGRIDEDRPCEFGVEDDAALGPRSRSCAVGPTARTAASRVAVAAY